MCVMSLTMATAGESAAVTVDLVAELSVEDKAVAPHLPARPCLSGIDIMPYANSSLSLLAATSAVRSPTFALPLWTVFAPVMPSRSIAFICTLARASPFTAQKPFLAAALTCLPSSL